MNHLQQEEYIEISEESQQVRFRLGLPIHIVTRRDDFLRQVSAQLEELDYRKLYRAYSGTIRKSQVEPKIMFKLLVCAYAKGVYTSRKIEELCRENIQFILMLDGHRAPDHCAIARFRSGKKTQEAIEDLFYQYAALLEKRGATEHEEVFIDGTKLESKANRYTFIWRKTVEKQLVKIKEKAKEALKLEGQRLTKGKLEQRISELNQEIAEQQLTIQKGRGHHKPAQIRERDMLQELRDRWIDYENKKQMIGEGRNSCSKTDPDATFMHMKEDHMRNGQLKPGYNVQFAVNSEFITGIGVFSNRTDYATLPPMLEMMQEKHGKKYERVVADSGYESLANYRYLHEHEQLAFIKPNNYETKKKRSYKKQIGRADNMAYYEEKDYFVCKNEKILDHIYTGSEKLSDGTSREVAHYRCEDCTDCPYRSSCCKSKDPQKPKELTICWEYERFRKESYERITTDEGKKLRVNRSIQSEGSFGQLKHNRNFKRFLLKGKCKVQTELYLLALSQNICKYIVKCNTRKLEKHLIQPKALLKF